MQITAGSGVQVVPSSFFGLVMIGLNHATVTITGIDDNEARGDRTVNPSHDLVNTNTIMLA